MDWRKERSVPQGLLELEQNVTYLKFQQKREKVGVKSWQKRPQMWQTIVHLQIQETGKTQRNLHRDTNFFPLLRTEPRQASHLLGMLYHWATSQSQKKLWKWDRQCTDRRDSNNSSRGRKKHNAGYNTGWFCVVWWGSGDRKYLTLEWSWKDSFQTQSRSSSPSCPSLLVRSVACFSYSTSVFWAFFPPLTRKLLTMIPKLFSAPFIT